MISPPDSEEHDAPEHMRLTLHGGKSFGTMTSSNNKRDSTPMSIELEEKILELRKGGWRIMSIAAQLRVGTKRIAKVLIKHGLPTRSTYDEEDN